MFTVFQSCCFFFFNDTATTEIYTLSLHDALPISDRRARQGEDQRRLGGVPGGAGGRHRGAHGRPRGGRPPARALPRAARRAGGRAPRARPRLRSAGRHVLRLGAGPARPDRRRARPPLPRGGARRRHPGQRVRRRRRGIHPAHALQSERAAARSGRAPGGPPPLAGARAMPHRVYIGIGSNLGDRKANALEAAERVAKLPGTRLSRASSLYESEPLGDAKTWFVNSVIEVETEFPPDELLKRLKAIEKAMGRKPVKGKRWGSRVIDLDILLCDQEVVETRSLKVPHPEMHKRRFVLLPLAELAPHVVHPQLGQTVSVLLAGVKDEKRVTLLPRA